MADNRNLMKKRFIVLYRLLHETTDEDHPLTTKDMLDYLEAEGIPTNRKTLKSDLDLLIESGADLVKVVSKPNRYFWGSRHFEQPELKLLIDAVNSSRFITDKKSRVLGEKLTNLASINQQKELIRHVYAANRIKNTNEEIYYTVDRINEAINLGKKISFKYTEYDINRNKVFRHDGEKYFLSPYALFWNEDFYYCIGYSDKHQHVSVFRVDRMYRPEITEFNSVPEPADFNLDAYSKQIFEMYDGDEETVTLLCRRNFMKYIIDRFGEDVDTKIVDGETFTATVSVALSPNFYAWVFRFGGGIKVIAPDKAVNEINSMAKAVMK